ncbi:AAA family ATPase [Pseudonocardia parietis]|uniref:MoxR-like ATPase n=1 Tax=Pseudonocardia parietis TaxID=570936 RepID=A0ABS4VMX0_9PSEU|nr:MoxR family ATPase [Pseudonocardia parietis]MBP2365126.1 MoxR-like ATPase [Pseudonocardia parietis]
MHETAINGHVPDTVIIDTAVTDTAITGSRVTGADGGSVRRVRARVARHLVGRERELDLLLAAVAAGRDVMLEGPPGTSKSTLLRAITTEWGIPLLFVEGNADLTPTRLVGHHNPARVLREDYTADNFVPGPLVEAMRTGGFLYVEEFNRAPEDTLNTLLTAMAERRIAVPRVGTVTAAPTFRVVASMNPYDTIGTTRLSTSVHDRLCRMAIDYQDAEAERGIVTRRSEISSGRLVADAVALTRATRERDDVRQGSSVRGAIDVALIAAQLAAMRDVALPEQSSVAPPRGLPQDYTALVMDAMLLALSGRIQLDETVEATPEQVLREIWEDHFLLLPAAAEPG